MLSFFSIISAPSSPTSSSAPARAPKPSPRAVTPVIIADASKYEVTIVPYMERPEYEDYGSDNKPGDGCREKSINYEQDWDKKDWDEDAEEWTGPNW